MTCYPTCYAEGSCTFSLATSSRRPSAADMMVAGRRANRGDAMLVVATCALPGLRGLRGLPGPLGLSDSPCVRHKIHRHGWNCCLRGRPVIENTEIACS